MNNQTKINIFAGTGGVGKTTLATSKAFFEASKGQNVLLITIDPSLRLKQILNIEKNLGNKTKVHFNQISPQANIEATIDALCFNPLNTLTKISIGEDRLKNIDQNRILKILTQPFGGMNEIMAYIELSTHFFAQEYDLIVLDTPPGKNFTDFINVFEKINLFFNNYFLEIFKYLPSITKQKKSGSIFKQFLSSGLSKLLSYLEKVTGPNFVDEFIKTISLLYQKKELFLKASSLEKYLNNPEVSTIYFTSSIDQIKTSELKHLLGNVTKIVSSKKYLLINKAVSIHLSQWTPSSPQETLLKNNLLKTENNLIQIAKENSIDALLFSENLSQNSSDHLVSLIKEWSKK